MSDKDYSLLRPFDLEVAKRGGAVCGIDGYTMKYIAGPNRLGTIVCQWADEQFQYYTAKLLRMAPLAWVEGKPVYKRDRLWHTNENTWWVAEGFNGIHPFGRLENHEGEDGSGLWMPSVDYLTWQPPKVKREGWVNVYGYGMTAIHRTKEEAEYAALNAHGETAKSFVTRVRIEWEE